MTELKRQMAAAKEPHVQGVGQILQEIGRTSPQAAALIEQDLENPELSLAACGKALYDYAKQHQAGGSWACAVFGLEPDNPVVRLVLDFYKIPSDWVCGAAAAPEPPPHLDAINLMDLL